jgi:hypothetical protein
VAVLASGRPDSASNDGMRAVVQAAVSALLIILGPAAAPT